MGYKIGSFNMRNLGLTSLGEKNERDLRTIARIIREEGFDIVALQEVLSQGKAFTASEYAKKSILMELGRDWDFQWADALSANDPRHEGYAFVWRKSRLRMCTSKITTPYGNMERTFYPRIYKERANTEDMIRHPYYGRFTANGVRGGTNVEFRLICVHTFYGKKDSDEERKQRQKELDVLLQNIYPQIADRRYGDPMKAYTILLGDYNAELWTAESKIWQEDLKKKRGGRRPMVMKTEDDGVVKSKKYDGRSVKTVQYELTTLKSKFDENGNEEFDTAGFSCNYDHFSYEEANFEDMEVRVRRLTSAVTKYCQNADGKYTSDFEKYYKTVSDHIPIMMEIEFR